MTKSNRMLKVLKEELRSITALNFIAKSSNIVEKIFWATLAISGTLFIYDAVSSQLETWKSNPILKTQEKIELKDLPILDITFCHKAMLKYGPTERFLNDINPKVDEISKEVLAIRNEYLKVQFEKFKDQFGDSDFCDWLFDNNVFSKDRYNDHIILGKLTSEEIEKLNKSCKFFMNGVTNFLRENNLYMRTLKENTYKAIEEGRWWNLEDFFKLFRQILDNDINAKTAVEDILKKPSDHVSDKEKHFILIIDGDEEMANPITLHLEEKKTYVEVEKCGSGNRQGREYVSGEFLDGKLVACGGWSHANRKECSVTGKEGSYTFNTSSRHSAFATKLNESMLWITGGFDEDEVITNSTEFVTVNSSVPGPFMNITLADHCVVKINESFILMIGGDAKDYGKQNKTWFVDLKNGFKMVEGPQMNNVRSCSACGKKLDDTGNTIVIAAGGIDEATVEFLNMTNISNWIAGPNLPYGVGLAKMIEIENRIMIVGGYNYSSEARSGKTKGILELVDFSSWRELPTVSKLRYGHLAFSVSENQKRLFCDNKSKDMVLFLNLIANDIKIGNSTLYDLTYKNLLEPNNIGTFIHHALVDAIQAGQDDNFQIMLSNVKKMMTAKEKDLGLVFMTPIFGLNDFSNMDFFEHFELDHGFMECMVDVEAHMIPTGYVKDNFDKFKVDIGTYKQPSPCDNLLGTFQRCQEFCSWTKNVSEKWSTMKLDTLQRYALPQSNLKIHNNDPVENEILESIFGTNYKPAKTTTFLPPFALPIFCKDNVKKRFEGDKINGFETKFCDSFNEVQTDVGICTSRGSFHTFSHEKIVLDLEEPKLNETILHSEHRFLLASDMRYNIDTDFKILIPRTEHRELGVQMQITQGKDFPQILYSGEQDMDERSITLFPGFEYVIELDPRGQKSTEDFQALSMEIRQCHLKDEIFEGASHPIYTKANCEFDCHVHVAHKTCKCVPWDFVHNITDATECDIFGRTCFFNMVANLTHESDTLCTHCIEECDWFKYQRRILEKNSLELKKKETTYEVHGATQFKLEYCNEYICIDPKKRNTCTGSLSMCEFIQDPNDAISDYYLKEAIWPNSYDSSGTRINSTFFKMAKTFMSKAIIVRLKYKEAEVELTKLDVRTTTTAKIANFGGTFGIWSELTGCSLLGIINLIIITFKVILRAR